jgi:hypothetical protein
MSGVRFPIGGAGITGRVLLYLFDSEDTEFALPLFSQIGPWHNESLRYAFRRKLLRLFH